jgi:ATP-binding cassette subfamily B protein
MSEKFNVLQAAMASSERIFSLLDTPVRIESRTRFPGPPATRRASPSPVGHITFENVWFAYNADRAEEDLAGRSDGPNGAKADWVLRDVSFDVQPGERVGIVGATGAGKSTLINLLLRFYDVTRGRILVDGVNVREMDLQELRGLFSLVLQDVHLFSGTIAGNVRLGETCISDQRVREAAAAVHADRFIKQLPQGFDAPVAERGATLSVGQKQLLSFARALAFDPRILILDEATSSVDTATELRIRDALHALMAGRTTIAIAHRLSTIQDMDKILVVHKGQLREAGRHQDLLARRGIYYKLYQLQYRDQEGGTAA